MEKIGVIVGNGKLPLTFLKEVEKIEDVEVFIVGLFDTIEEDIKNYKNFKKFSIGEVGNITKYLLLNDINRIVMLGKVEKNIMFSDISFDKYGEEIIASLPDRKDETLLFAVIAFFRLNGIKVLSQNYLLKNIMFKEKCYTKVFPDKEDMKTIKIGIEAAKHLSEIDAGQTVVCKNRSIIALEGIEGTDETILRAGKLVGSGTLIVKMARPQQDTRVDIPVVGISTIKKIIEINAKGIIGEANKMIFLDQEEAIKIANENGIFIVGVKP